MRTRLLALLLSYALAACSPADPLPPQPAAAMAAALADAARASHLSVRRVPSPTPVRAAVSSTAQGTVTERLLDFGEVFFAQYFPAGPTTQALGPWLYRYYPRTGTYLGVNSGWVYVMGGPFGTTPVQIGPVSDFVVNTGSVADLKLAALPATLTDGDFVPLRAVPLDAAGKGVADAVVQWSGTPGIAKLLRDRLAALVGVGALTLRADAAGRSASVAREVAARDLGGKSVAILVGPEETVFDADRQACDQSDQPDVPARAVRMPDGSLLLFAGNDPMNYVSSGTTFDSLERRCSPALRAADDLRSETFHNREWIASVYREGDVIHALVHNEYHDPFTAECMPGHSGSDNPCWYNTITYAKSSDGGLTFSAPTAPGHVIAPPPRVWNGADPVLRSQPFGYFEPSNILKREDGYYYAAMNAIVDPDHPNNRGLCVMRTATISDPGSWRGWDGSAYTVSFANPYVAGGATAQCVLVTRTGLHFSLTYNSFLGQYMLVSTSREWIDGEQKCGFFFAVSSDLVHWSSPLYFSPAYLYNANGVCPAPSGNLAVSTYATFIDHDSTGLNFDTVGQVPYLYYTLWTDPVDGRRRNLVRRPVVIVKSSGYTGDVTPPEIFLDVPAVSATVTGSAVEIAGWAYDSSGTTGVQVLVDSTPTGTATTGLQRPDVAAGFPGYPSGVGYRYLLDSTRYANGPHQLSVRTADPSNNTTVRTVSITIKN